MQITQVCDPTSDDGDDAGELLYEEVEYAIDPKSNLKKIIAIGDFNSKYEKDETNQRSRKHFTGMRNE